MTPLSIDGLTVARGHQIVLRDVSLVLDGPGLFGLIGPNGGGKTTLLSVICALLPFSRGTIRLLGLPPRRAIGRVALVPQVSGFDRGFPITLRGMIETALVGPGLFSRPGSRGAERVESAMAQTGISALANRPLTALSGGELQRGLVARALAVEPGFLVLDEPSASVDPHHADRIFDLLCECSRRIPVLLASHDLARVAAHCDGVFGVDRQVWQIGRGASVADLAAEIFRADASCARHAAVG
jgi:zinc transport system ATP-binding protein